MWEINQYNLLKMKDKNVYLADINSNILYFYENTFIKKRNKLFNKKNITNTQNILNSNVRDRSAQFTKDER